MTDRFKSRAIADRDRRNRYCVPRYRGRYDTDSASIHELADRKYPAANRDVRYRDQRYSRWRRRYEQ